MVLKTRLGPSLTAILFITWISVPVFGQESTTAQQTTQPSTTEQSGGTSGRDCRIDSFKLQPDFELVRLQGLWHGITINKYCNWLSVPSFLPLPQTNLQADYRLVADDQFEIHAAGAFVIPFCDYIKGNAVIEDKTQPQKLAVNFQTMFKSKTYPYWVAKTDYDGYAVMYSCWQKMANGTCHPEYSYLWTLNRKPTGHTPEQMEEIRQAAADLCIHMDNYQTFKQDGGCEFDPNDPPKGGTLFMFLLSCFCVLIVLLIMLCCCCICTGNTDDFKRKKMQ